MKGREHERDCQKLRAEVQGDGVIWRRNEVQLEYCLWCAAAVFQTKTHRMVAMERDVVDVLEWESSEAAAHYPESWQGTHLRCSSSSSQVVLNCCKTSVRFWRSAICQSPCRLQHMIVKIDIQFVLSRHLNADFPHYVAIVWTNKQSRYRGSHSCLVSRSGVVVIPLSLSPTSPYVLSSCLNDIWWPKCGEQIAKFMSILVSAAWALAMKVLVSRESLLWVLISLVSYIDIR